MKRDVKDNISSNLIRIRKLAFQDAFAHKGTDMENHDVLNDRWGDTFEAEAISSSAVTIFKLLSGDWKNLGDKIDINTTGMSQSQFDKIISRLRDYMDYLKDDEEEDEW